MKKITPIVTILCLMLSLFALAGCDSSSGSNNSSNTQSSSPAFNYDGPIEETVLVDNDVLKVVARQLTYENNQALLDLSITNKTGVNLSVAASTLAYPANYINSYMVPGGWFNEEVPSGETIATESIYSLDELRMYGIRSINELGIGIYATDDNYDTVYQDVSSIKTSLGDNNSDTSFNEAINDSLIQELLGATVKNTTTNIGTLTYNGLKFNAATLVKNSDGDYALMYEVENSTDIPMSIPVTTLNINGQLVYEYQLSGVYLEPGKKRVDTIDLSYYLEDAGMSDINDSINEVSFSYSIHDEKNNTLAGETQCNFAF